MSLTSGFFNSKNGDRKYTAEQFGDLFDGLISDGVFATWGDAFAVTPGSGMTVQVGTGKAWLDHTWVKNDAALSVTIPAASSSQRRLDTIVIDVDRRSDVRNCSIYVVEGPLVTGTISIPTSAAGDYINTDERVQYPLAFVCVNEGVTSIEASNIYYAVGQYSMSGEPRLKFVTGIIDTVSAEVFVERLEAEWEEMQASYKERFDAEVAEVETWLDDFKSTLTDDDVAANLTARVLDLEDATAGLGSVEMHRNIFRGKELGTSVTSSQLAAIQNGTFDDLYVGDYWKMVSCTNQIPISTDTDGSVYNDTGYLPNSRFTGDGSIGTNTSYTQSVTGYIPVALGDVIRFANMTVDLETTVTAKYASIVFYTSDMSVLAVVHNGVDETETFYSDMDASRDENGYLIQFTIKEHTNLMPDTVDSTVAYMRVSAQIDSTSVISVNENIYNAWRIADINYWKWKQGTAGLTSNHLVIVPDVPLYETQMNSSNVTSTGYYGSALYATLDEQAAEKVNAAFGDIVLNHSAYLSSAASSGNVSACVWVSRAINLMNDSMVYGAPLMRSTPSYSSTKVYTSGADTTQLALFRLNPITIYRSLYSDEQVSYWLRDVSTTTQFSYVASGGSAMACVASDSRGVRPAFAIG